jgi:hypothetical protein
VKIVKTLLITAVMATMLAAAFSSGASAFDASRSGMTIVLHCDLDATEAVWDFGDDQGGRGLDVCHTYQYGGEYEVTLYAKLPSGNWTTETLTFNLEGPARPEPVVNASAPYQAPEPVVVTLAIAGATLLAFVALRIIVPKLDAKSQAVAGAALLAAAFVANTGVL